MKNTEEFENIPLASKPQPRKYTDTQKLELFEQNRNYYLRTK